MVVSAQSPVPRAGAGESARGGKGKRPLVVLVGPTAVGKTSLSLHLAEGLDGEIVSADARFFEDVLERLLCHAERIAFSDALDASSDQARLAVAPVFGDGDLDGRRTDIDSRTQ